MLRWFVRRQLAAYERDHDYDLSYSRDILNASLRAFFRFYQASQLAAHQEDLPRDAAFAARITTSRSEDCGPCTQLVVTLAERAGVAPDTLRAILAGNEAAMPADAALGYRFAVAVIARDIEESDRLRKEVTSRWGQRAVVSLALAIAGTRIFPTIKYALGHGHACTRVRVAGVDSPLVGQAHN
jgi:alkylhydroperoxidase family enzyme